MTYFKEESIALAIDLLDEAELRPGEKSTKINVQQVCIYRFSFLYSPSFTYTVGCIQGKASHTKEKDSTTRQEQDEEEVTPTEQVRNPTKVRCKQIITTD